MTTTIATMNEEHDAENCHGLHLPDLEVADDVGLAPRGIAMPTSARQ